MGRSLPVPTVTDAGGSRTPRPPDAKGADAETERPPAGIDPSRAALGAATLVALVATAGSLGLSLGLGLSPCRLCWYQRILMYPLVVVLGVAVAERRAGVWRTALPLSTAGTVVAAYHSWLQVAASGSRCTLGAVSCGAVQFRLAGLSVPNLALVAFLLVTALAVVAGRRG